MLRIRASILRKTFFALLIFSQLSLVAWARPKANDKLIEQDRGKSYALPYALVVLGVALGVMLVARPGTRGDQAKRKIEEEDDD